MTDETTDIAAARAAWLGDPRVGVIAGRGDREQRRRRARAEARMIAKDQRRFIAEGLRVMRREGTGTRFTA